MMRTQRILATVFLLSPCLRLPVAFAQTNLVSNGDFEKDEDGNGVPDTWATAGAAHVKQQLTRDVGREGKGSSARLACTEFNNGTPSSHAMICEVGVVSVKRDRWYRLTFWAKGEGLRGGLVHVALSDMRKWENAGLSDGISPRGDWKRYEMVFRSTLDLPAQASRLQFWFNSTGTFWLDDVELVETDMKPQWHPQLVTEGRVNVAPNSSFECGTAGWGSYSPELRWWQGNAYQLIGDLDDTTAAHGKHSLRLSLSERTLPTFFFDYFDPVRQPIRSLVTAHEGWLPAERGQQYTLSAFLKADQPGRVGVLFVRQADGRNLRKDSPLTTEWQRYVFAFTAETDFLWTGVGLDLAASKTEAATAWVDAVQLEKGSQATPYQPALPVEVMATTDRPGNLFPSDRYRATVALQLHAFNNAVSQQTTNLTLMANDFYDAEVWRKALSVTLPPQSGTATTVDAAFNKLGFFRVQVAQDGEAPHQQLRCAALRPISAQTGLRFGMNHAYPWNFLLPLAHRAGIRWWRDWSVQWRTVQPRPEAAFEFREPDAQIDRVLGERGKALVLFPFPSSDWCSTAEPATVEKMARNDYERRRIPLAFKPKDKAAFSGYIGESVRHYRNRIAAYQVFNEALYTSYALPASAGHTVDDYVQLLRLAYSAIKQEQPGATVLGGVGIWADSKWTRDFVEAGGLKYVDALDLHLYPKGDPEPYGESLAQLWQRMKERGEARPIWLTELGCYADDDPAITPFGAYFGDAAMRQALHDSEREASEWLVKFATLFFANGGERLFLHAGTCGEINGQDAGGVFFEYGGAPRKMLCATATMADYFTPDARFDRVEQLGEDVVSYWFMTRERHFAVAWSTDGAAHEIRSPYAIVSEHDLMGNVIAGRAKTVGASPVYLVHWPS